MMTPKSITKGLQANSFSLSSYVKFFETMIIHTYQYLFVLSFIPLSNIGQLLIPGELVHVGGSGLSGLLTFGNLPPQLVVHSYNAVTISLLGDAIAADLMG